MRLSQSLILAGALFAAAPALAQDNVAADKAVATMNAVDANVATTATPTGNEAIAPLPAEPTAAPEATPASTAAPAPARRGFPWGVLGLLGLLGLLGVRKVKG